MNNYELCTQWVLEQRQENSQTRVLDYGCGAGEIIKLLHQNKVDAFGCDVFFDGAEYPELIESKLFGTAILPMADNKIPFPDNHFDLVVNNQVMEHVEDLDSVLSEIDRVLKPNGRILSVFPDRDTWREGHCEIPFLHWFPKGSRLRVYYALCLRLLGFGSYTAGKQPLQWSEDICIWLDRWTHYRSSQELDRYYSQYFTDVRSIETYWLTQRVKDRIRFIEWVPSFVRNTVARKFAGRVIVAQSKTNV
jgi:SAM-dependent methyltransferase